MKIDIIIPAYNAQNTIIRCICSIAMQSIIDDVHITIVNDGSDGDYSQVREMFYDYTVITEMPYNNNMGPGYARRYGLEHTENPYVMFIDADDTLQGSFALKILRDELDKDEHVAVVSGAFIEETMAGTFLMHNQDMTWMFGKMYKRSFLDKYNITFNDTRSNEDTGFNTLVKLCCNPNERITFHPDIAYVWHASANSITRANDCDYSFNGSFVGYTENMIWAIKRLWEKNPKLKDNVNAFACEIMAQLYFYFIEGVARKPEYTEQNLGCCRKYYQQVYSLIEMGIPEETKVQKFNLAAEGFFALKKNQGFIPSVGYNEFLAILKN